MQKALCVLLSRFLAELWYQRHLAGLSMGKYVFEDLLNVEIFYLLTKGMHVWHPYVTLIRA
jgi:hypothetical protein